MRFSNKLVVGGLAASLLASAIGKASGPKAPQISGTPETMMMPLVAPMLIQDRSLRNTLTLVSNSDIAMTAKASVRDRLGREIAEAAVPLEAHSQSEVDITKLLTETLGDRAFIGYLLVSSEDANFASLAAQLSITREEPLNPVYVEEELLMVGTKPDNSFRGTIANAAAPAVVAVTNVTGSPQTVVVTCIPEEKRPSTGSITLAGGQMTLLSVCGERISYPSPQAAMSPDEKFSSRQALGISVSSPGMPGGLAVYGLGYVDSPGPIRAVSMPFQQSAFTYSSSAAYMGVPVGTTERLGSSVFYPEAAVTNFGARPTHVTVDYYSTANDDQSISTPVLHTTVPAQATVALSLPNLPGDSRLRNSFVISADATPGQFYSSLRAVSSGAEIKVVDLPGKIANRSIMAASILGALTRTQAQLSSCSTPMPPRNAKSISPRTPLSANIQNITALSLSRQRPLRWRA